MYGQACRQIVTGARQLPVQSFPLSIVASGPNYTADRDRVYERQTMSGVNRTLLRSTTMTARSTGHIHFERHRVLRAYNGLPFALTGL